MATTPSPLDALKPLAGRALEAALNRMLALDPETRASVRKLDGRRISLALEAPAIALEIKVDGDQLRVGPVQADEPDLGIRATLAGALAALPFGAAYAIGAVCEVLWRVLPIKGEPPLTRFLAEQLSTTHWYSMAPAKRDFGYVPGVTIEEGLERLAADWKKRRA